MLKKGDLILIGVVAAIVVSYTGFKLVRQSDEGVHKIAVIKQENKVFRTIDLNLVQESERIKVPGSYDEIILVEKGRIRFEEADCPDRVCVRTGWLSKSGDTAVCIPNRTMIVIQGGKAKVDGVAF